jgi:hypothetical protein
MNPLTMASKTKFFGLERIWGGHKKKRTHESNSNNDDQIIGQTTKSSDLGLEVQRKKDDRYIEPIFETMEVILTPQEEETDGYVTPTRSKTHITGRASPASNSIENPAPVTDGTWSMFQLPPLDSVVSSSSM